MELSIDVLVKFSYFTTLLHKINKAKASLCNIIKVFVSVFNVLISLIKTAN